MPRPILARFDLPAFGHNLVVARRHAPRSRIWAVVKANAYGHGLLRAAGALNEADGYALLDPADAIRLREAEIAGPILLLEGCFNAADVALAGAHRLTAVVHDKEQIAMLRQARPGHPVDVYLKLNTGMNRLGFPAAQAAGLYAELKACDAVGEITLMTHFADADGATELDWQLQEFNAATAGIRAPRSVCNSAAILRHPEAHGDWVRPGIMLYGCSPFADASAEQLGLKPVMTLMSEIIAVQQIKPGDTVGYSRTFRAQKAMRIGVVACGYADGYPRHAPSGSPVLVDGRRTATVGRVSMDMMCVDLAGIPGAGIGAPVTLWGEGLSADEVGAAAGTVSYELLCALAARVPQIDVNG